MLASARVQPLAGLLVVDLTRHLPGPFASRELLRLGARVVRLESPDGDPLRDIAPQWDAALNAGKESVACDLKAEPELSYVLVNFAVLSPQSVAATRAALAYLQLYGPERYLPLHLALFSLRGTVDGERALAEAEKLGGDRRRMTELADSTKTTGWMKDAFATGNDLGLVATPSFLIGTEAYIGGMSLEQKREAIARARG